MLPRLTFTWFCFICGIIPLVFTFDYCRCRRLSEPNFISSGWMSLSFSMCGAGAGPGGGPGRLSLFTKKKPTGDLLWTSSLVFFKDFHHTISLILCRTAILKKIYFCRSLTSMAACVHSLNFNGHRVCILFFPIETFVCNCSSLQKKLENRKTKYMWFSLFYRDKILQR